MRAVLVWLLLLAYGPAWAEMVPIASNGQWTTLADTTSPVKVCAIQADVGGGRFTLWGATDHQGVLRLSLYKSTWTITNVPVPIVLTFPGGNVVNLTGTGTQSIIRADVPTELVKPLIHYFTAFDTGTITLPEGHELAWTLDLHGTTPATVAMAKCIDEVQVTLPPPFQLPAQVAANPTHQPLERQPALPPAPSQPAAISRNAGSAHVSNTMCLGIGSAKYPDPICAATREFCSSHTQMACLIYRSDTIQCYSLATAAQGALAEMRMFRKSGVTPRQAMNLAIENGIDARSAEEAARAPETMTEDELRSVVLADCARALARE